MLIFSKNYSGESIVDLEGDIIDSLDSKYNPLMESIPTDEYGFREGQFIVKVEWVPN